MLVCVCVCVCLCGLPLECPADDRDLAWGTDSYVDQFLETVLSQLDVRLGALTKFMQTLGPSSVAGHAALHVLRINLLPRFVHLFRFLPVDRSLQLARSIDERLLPWLQEQFDLPLAHPAVRIILQTPCAHGGLSLLRLHHEALLHCISGLLALPVEGVPLTPVECDSLTLASAVLLRLTGVDAPKVTAHHLPHRRPAHLRRLVYEALAQQLTVACPWLLAPPLDAAALKAGVTLRFQYRLLMGWYEATGCNLLTAPVLRHAMAVHYRLPVFPVPGRCQYVTLTSGTPCMHALDPHGTHVHACAYGPQQRRHDAMRDIWCTLLRKAGWTVSIEQLVLTAPQASKRADILVTTQGGLAFALDLTFSAPLDDAGPPGPHLHCVNAAKAARYGVSPCSTLPQGTVLTRLWHTVLIVHSCTPMLSICYIEQCWLRRASGRPRLPLLVAFTWPH